MLTPSGQTPACMCVHPGLPSAPTAARLGTAASFVSWSSYQRRPTAGISSTPMSEQINTRKLSIVWMFCRKHAHRQYFDYPGTYCCQASNPHPAWKLEASQRVHLYPRENHPNTTGGQQGPQRCQALDFLGAFKSLINLIFTMSLQGGQYIFPLLGQGNDLSEGKKRTHTHSVTERKGRIGTWVCPTPKLQFFRFPAAGAADWPPTANER